MPTFNFLFTYSVSPMSDEATKIQKANSTRRQIAEIEKDKWEKLTDVETAFAGEIYLESYIASKQRKEAQEIVSNELKKVIDENKALFDIWVSVALMVDGLGECIEFKI